LVIESIPVCSSLRDDVDTCASNVSNKDVSGYMHFINADNLCVCCILKLCVYCVERVYELRSSDVCNYWGVYGVLILIYEQYKVYN